MDAHERLLQPTRISVPAKPSESASITPPNHLNDGFTFKCPEFVDEEVNGHGDEDGDEVGPVEFGAESGGVVEDMAG